MCQLLVLVVVRPLVVRGGEVGGGFEGGFIVKNTINFNFVYISFKVIYIFRIYSVYRIPNISEYIN